MPNVKRKQRPPAEQPEEKEAHFAWAGRSRAPRLRVFTRDQDGNPTAWGEATLVIGEPDDR